MPVREYDWCEYLRLKEADVNDSPQEPRTPVGDATTIESPTEPADQGAGAGDAWRDVVTRLDELGDAIGRWANAAVNDPDNRQRVQELKEHIDAMGDKVSEAIDGASDSDAGQKVRGAAEKAGDAIKDFGERFSDEVFPRMASAFEGAASKLQEAAEKMESKSDKPDADDVADDVIL
jgi:hypothetical protein